MIEENYNSNENDSERIEDNELINQLKRDFNAALIYYMLTECKEYEIIIDNGHLNTDFSSEL